MRRRFDGHDDHRLRSIHRRRDAKPSTESQIRDEMVEPQIQIFSKFQFPTLPREMTDENRGIELGYGLGWGTFRMPYGKAYFKEGRDDGWENHAVCFPDKKMAVIFMSNSSNGNDVFIELLETLVKDRSTPGRWENYKPFTKAN